MVRGFNHYPDAAKAINKDLFFSLSNHALIIVSKFLEVWEDSNGFAKSEPRIVPMRKALSPFINRITVWKGIRSLRNSALAHAYLDKNGGLTTPWQQLATGAAPSYHAEIVLLLQLVYLSVLAILTVFEKEFGGIELLCGPGPIDDIPPGPGITHGSEIKGALEPIARKVEELLISECRVKVQGRLLKSFIKATTPDAV
jgi:hypothetical protein